MRSQFLKIFFVFAALVFTWDRAFATHNRAGEITYTQINQLTYQVTLTTYTDTRSPKADRPIITLDWGDNTTSDITRQSQITLPNFVWKNTYISTHTYSGPGQYLISFQDPNRVAGVLNMTPDQSVNTPFYVESLLIIDPQRGIDHSPVLLNPPIQNACAKHKFTDNPDAFDQDGDSLHFTLIPPLQARNTPVPGYFTPPHFILDPNNGEITWDSAVIQGIYNFAIRVDEYRDGQRIGYIIRDLQIIVVDCGANHPPKLQPLHDTCIEAGTNFNYILPIKATDPDDSDHLQLTANGGPFMEAIRPARLINNPALGIDSVKALFEWEVDCSHIRKQPYTVIFKVVDHDSAADVENMQIRVVGPEPLHLTATPAINSVALTWQKPVCANPVGYYIYRRADSSTWQHAKCEIGVPGYVGYQLIDTITDPNTLSLIDDNHGRDLAPGIRYCYLVTAVYLNPGQFEFVEGYASNEACAQLKKNVPVMTHASVRTTDAINGSMYVDWSKPLADKLDTNLYPGPYKYELYRSAGINGTSYTLLTSSVSSTFSGLNDTIYIDTMLNTAGSPYNYMVKFYNTPKATGKFTLLGKTISASSVYLNIGRGYKSMVLSWNVLVPWENSHYIIYRHNNTTSNWDSIGTSTTQTYTDSGLVNGKPYCYYVVAYGSYFTSGYTSPLINYSERMCSSPRDTVKPCPPAITAEADCDARNTALGWSVRDSCTTQVNRYKVYYSPGMSNKFVLVDSVMGRAANSYTDDRPSLYHSLAGCYYITALDSYDNESRPSNEVCVDNCPVYQLPNVITPNGDEMNDLLTPMPGYRFIESIDLKVYNRWGQEVFHTLDPAINWDGTDIYTHKPLADGMYYYTCSVYEIYLIGLKETSLKGAITIIRKP